MVRYYSQTVPADSSLRTRLAVVALIAAGTLVALLSLWAEVNRRQRRVVALGALEQAALPAAETDALRAALERQDDPSQVRIAVARTLVNRVLEPPPHGPANRAETEVPRLEIARTLAARAHAERPAAWRPPLLLGAATYLARDLARDRRLVTEASAWDAPLARSRELGPGSDEPVRFLVLAYLELWPALSEAKRAEASELLHRALADPRTFARLIEPWLEIAGDADTALAPVPDQPWAWSRLQRTFAERGDWRRAEEMRRRWRHALAGELELRLEEAADLRRRGDLYEARRSFLSVAADAPTERRFVPLVQRALSDAPAGPAWPSLATRLGHWLDWSLALSLTGPSPLPAEDLHRLAGLVTDLAPPQAAHAAVAAGRLAEAERIERRAFNGLGAESWSAYRVAKARDLLDRGRPVEALDELQRADRTWADRPALLRTLRDAARAAGHRETADGAVARLAALAADPGGPADWLSGPVPRREIVVTEPLAGLVVDGVVAGAGTALVEVRLDGHLLAADAVRQRGRLRVEAPVAPGVHLLEIVPAGGAPFVPGAVTATPAQGAGTGRRAAHRDQGEGVGG